MDPQTTEISSSKTWRCDLTQWFGDINLIVREAEHLKIVLVWYLEIEEKETGEDNFSDDDDDFCAAIEDVEESNVNEAEQGMNISSNDNPTRNRLDSVWITCFEDFEFLRILCCRFFTQINYFPT